MTQGADILIVEDEPKIANLVAKRVSCRAVRETVIEGLASIVIVWRFSGARLHSERAEARALHSRLRRVLVEGLGQIHAEIEDRYGRVPDSVNNLFDHARLRRQAEEMRLTSVDRTADGIALKLAESSRVSPEAIMQLVTDEEGVSFSPAGILRFPILSGGPITAAMEMLRRIRA